MKNSNGSRSKIQFISEKNKSKSPNTKICSLMITKIKKNIDNTVLRPNKSKLIISKKYLNDSFELSKVFNEKKKDKQYKKNSLINKPNKYSNPKVANIDNENISATTKDSSLTSIKIVKENNNNNKNKNINFLFSKNNYCHYYPKKDEMRERTDKKPIHFPNECFHGVNHSHNNIGNKEYLYLTDNSIYNNNIDEYKIIEKKDHLLLNHLCQKSVNKKIINSITVKFRHKNTTFLYFS